MSLCCKMWVILQVTKLFCRSPISIIWCYESFLLIFPGMFQHVEIAVAVMPELEKLVASGKMTEDLASIARVAIIQVMEQKSTKLDSDYIQRQIDAFIKDEVMDFNQTTPGGVSFLL